MKINIKLMKRLARQILRPILRFKQINMRQSEVSKTALVELINHVGESDLIMIEIGSYRGESAELFLSTGKVKKLYCVDPWAMYYDADDGASFSDMHKVECDFDRRVGADKRVVKVKGSIDTFVEKHSTLKEKIDFVYIDGLHTYEGVRHDIEIVRDKIKPRIAIAGHDYCPGLWDGAVKAVHEQLGKPDATFQDTSWLIFTDDKS